MTSILSFITWPIELCSLPSFKDFVLASQRIAGNGSLIWRHGVVDQKSSYEEGEQSLSRRTWRVFASAIDEAFSFARQSRIARRYGFDWGRFARSSLPVEKRYVVYFGVGAATVTEEDLKEAQWQKWWLKNRSTIEK